MTMTNNLTGLEVMTSMLVCTGRVRKELPLLIGHDK